MVFFNFFSKEKTYIKQFIYFNNMNKEQELLLFQGLYKLKQAV